MDSGQTPFFFFLGNRFTTRLQPYPRNLPDYHRLFSRLVSYVCVQIHSLLINYLHTGIYPLFFVSKSSFSYICSVICHTGLSPDSGPGFPGLCQSGHATAYLTHHMKNNTFSAKVCKTWQKPRFTYQSFFIIRNDISGTLVPSQRS